MAAPAAVIVGPPQPVQPAMSLYDANKWGPAYDTVMTVVGGTALVTCMLSFIAMITMGLLLWSGQDLGTPTDAGITLFALGMGLLAVMAFCALGLYLRSRSYFFHNAYGYNNAMANTDRAFTAAVLGTLGLLFLGVTIVGIIIWADVISGLPREPGIAMFVVGLVILNALITAAVIAGSETRKHNPEYAQNAQNRNAAGVAV